jgi:hypothetical protein
MFSIGFGFDHRLTYEPSGWMAYPASRQDEIFAAFTILCVAMCLWIASESLTTKQFGITKKGLGLSHTLGWGDITEIRLHKKQGGAIKSRAVAGNFPDNSMV